VRQIGSAHTFGAWLAAGSDDSAWTREVPENQLESVLQKIMQYETEAVAAPQPLLKPVLQETEQALELQEQALKAQLQTQQALQAQLRAQRQAEKWAQPLKPGPQPMPEPAPEPRVHSSPPLARRLPLPSQKVLRPAPRAMLSVGRDETSLTSLQLTLIAAIACGGITFGIAVGTTVARRACRPQPPPADEPVLWEDDGDWAVDPDGLCQRSPVRRVILPLLRRMVARQNQIFRL
jgi:hypothetical protein